MPHSSSGMGVRLGVGGWPRRLCVVLSFTLLCATLTPALTPTFLDPHTDLSACAVIKTTTTSTDPDVTAAHEPTTLPFSRLLKVNQTVDYYVTGQTRELMNGTASQVVRVTRLGDLDFRMMTAVSLDAGGCDYINHTFTYDRRLRRLWSTVDPLGSGSQLFMYLLRAARTPACLHPHVIAVLVRMEVNGRELTNQSFISLWSSSPHHYSLRPGTLRNLVAKWCPTNDHDPDIFFDDFIVDGNLMADCGLQEHK